MKWFYNIKIGSKLVISFIIVALIAGIVGGVGIFNLKKSVDDFSDLYENYGKALGDIADASISYQMVRINLRDLLLDKGYNDRNKYVNNVENYDKQIHEDIAQFEKSIQTEDGRKTINDLKDALDRFDPYQQKIIELALAGNEEQGLALLRGETAVATATEINDEIAELFKLKDEKGAVVSNDLTNSANKAINTMIIIVLAGVIVAMILGICISKMISNPIKKLVAVANEIADGELNVEVNVDSKDEIGMLSAAFAKMADNLNEVIANIISASEQVASGSNQISDLSVALAQGSTEQASSVEELTASLEEVSSQTRTNADNAGQASKLSEDARSNAVHGNIQMEQMIKAMGEINDSSNNISKIIKVIDEIAFQTNILALNAAVEAARAGQHGKGFAVVAEEVRNLAVRSANAAKETTTMIEESMKKVEGGTKIANETSTALNTIVAAVEKAANLVSNIAIASNEQATAISQINQGIMQVSEVIQANSSTSQESATASEELAGQAVLLKAQVEKFKLKKINPTNAYLGLEGINPDVLRMPKEMNDRSKQDSGKVLVDEYSSPKITKIALSDNEFGKY